ncbi:MAG: hypothetical protein QXF52_09965 [Thermoproteota archaeon]
MLKIGTIGKVYFLKTGGMYALSLSRPVVAKLKRVLIIDLLIIAFAAGAYYYTQIQELNVEPADFQAYNLQIDPDEAWPNQTIKISVEVSNIRSVTGTYVLNLTVKDEVWGNKTLQLGIGESTTVEFTVSKAEEGSYPIKIGGLSGEFKIVPVGTHTLIVKPHLNITGLSFLLNNENHSIPYSAVLNEGTYTISVPEECEARLQNNPPSTFRFMNWGDNSRELTITINLVSKMEITVIYGQVQSCPWLYIWNGTSYVFVAEISGSGYLGYFDRSRVPPAFNKPYPWDYVKLDRSQLQPRNGSYDMVMTQVTDEIIYLDGTWLMMVDHPPDLNVYSSKGTEFTDPSIASKIFTVSKNLSPPVSCINDLGEDCLPQISKLDEVYASVHEFGKWQYFELNLGNLSGAKEIRLVINGYTSWFLGWERKWVELLGNPDFLESKPSVYPYLQVKDENGSWMSVPKNRDIPEFAATPRTFIVELTGLFPTSNYSIRINTLILVHIDFIGVDTSPQQNVTIYRLNPVSADLHQKYDTLSTSKGNFTRFGDVAPLLYSVDDMFVVMRQGDEIHLIIPNTIEPPQENMERDFFLVTCAWYKKNGNPAYDFTVDLLPFYDMSAFPYPDEESYPYDAEHLEYLSKYNTREFK